MPDHDVESASTTDGLPVAPGLGPSLEAARVPVETRPVDGRVVFLCGLAIALGIAAGFVAQALSALIALLTNISFFGRFSTTFTSPAENHLGAWVILVPVAGAIVVGFMARYGSKAIRGHGIPEAMEQVLTNQSRVPPRMTLLKPLSAAVAIGTGGPFGAEGPIIATGGALGSLVGQVLKTTANERKTLLAAGAAAGMAAIFGTPVAAVLLAVELLLFEFRARSIIPVSLAACAATAVYIVFNGHKPAFAMPDIEQPGSAALVCYVAIGALTAVAAVGVTRAVYFVEELFEKLPIHWMWWPAIGGLAVGVVGIVSPRTLGVGYDNIEDFLAHRSELSVVAALCAWKFVSWSIALGSGTSGGTLAPLFTMGGGLGAVLGTALTLAFPGAGVDVRIAALVGMASMFAGASRAALASVVFAFETTRQPISLLPLLGGCTASHLISGLLMRNTIMTEKIVKRGLRVASEYSADFLDQILVKDRASRDVVTLPGAITVEEARTTILAGGPGKAHQGFPVVGDDGRLLGVVTRRDLFGNFTDRALPLSRVLTRPPVVIYEDSSLREAADHMVRENVGRLVVVRRDDPARVAGILTRSDLLEAHRRRIDEADKSERGLALSSR